MIKPATQETRPGAEIVCSELRADGAFADGFISQLRGEGAGA